MKLNLVLNFSTSCGFEFTLFLKVIHKVGITSEYPYFSAIYKRFLWWKSLSIQKIKITALFKTVDNSLVFIKTGKRNLDSSFILRRGVYRHICS